MSAAYLGDTDSEDEVPNGWEERLTEDGRVYYANHSTSQTQWIHPKTGARKYVPKELPYGWTKQVDEDGTVIFFQESTGKKTHTDPRLAFSRETKQSVYDFKQRFDASSTAFQVLNGVDLTGKRALITGATCGIGLETAKSLAKHGCEVILACRSSSRANEAIEEIKAIKATAIVEFVKLDLESLTSVKTCANEVLIKFRTLDYLICNAGVFGAPFKLTEDNYERTFQVNVLSHFYLILLCKPLLISTKGSRIIILSSESHRSSLMTPENICEEYLSPRVASNFVAFLAYGDTKLCDAILATEIDRRWGHEGIICNSVHPGNMISTEISRNWWFYRLLFFIVRPFTKSLQQGAATTVWGATAEELNDVSGQYLNNCWLCAPTEKVTNRDMGESLWSMSIAMIERVMGVLPANNK
ncbi:WW domain-containing oxidoreductase [Folsomia candida]|uniref:WW domain-containing oxidoreductase n=1 Tax=Folsomia candida TaxID=158441 RepID=UPI000B90750E|nr:WW domain-containing oxidoreductase [Folsomia candida]